MVTMRLGIGLALGALVASGGACRADAQPSGVRHVRASLVAESGSVRAGETLVVGFHLEMEPGWHTYWRNPGDAGLPTRVTWRLPEGFAAGELQWPRPIRFLTGPLVSYGYEHEVLHPVEIRVPASLKGNQVRLAARLSWLECRDACLPGKADLELTLPVGASARPAPAAPLFVEARRRLPGEAPGWTLGAGAREGAIDLTVRPPRGTTLSEAYFYPSSRRVLDYSKPQALAPVKGGYRLELPRDPNGEAGVDRLTGVLVAGTAQGERVIAVDVAVNDKPAGRAAPASTTHTEEGTP